MTAQIGIINREVAVLASDAATTVFGKDNIKIFKSINKIHKIADHIPVAFMINGNPHLSIVSWKRILDLYRKLLGNEEKESLYDYYQSIIEYIESDNNLVGYENNLSFLRTWTIRTYQRLENITVKNGKINHVQFTSRIKRYTERVYNLNSFIIDSSKFDIVSKSIGSVLSNSTSILHVRYPKFLKKYYKKILENFTIIFLKELSDLKKTGLIIAGFGRNDVFPSLIEVHIEGLFENKLRISKPLHHKIGISYLDKTKTLSRILTFAQSDGARIFLEGIDPDIKKAVSIYASFERDEIITFLKDHYLFSKIEKDDRLQILNDLKLYSDRQTVNYKRDLNKLISNHINPITRSIEAMSPLDIIELARTLVNLTSLKRQYSINQLETAGGVTDVVMLSKEKGFETVLAKKTYD